jgi:hypothetical protein
MIGAHLYILRGITEQKLKFTRPNEQNTDDNATLCRVAG